MFQIIRQYAPMMLILLMSLFVAALAIDEYNDSRRMTEDLRIESCVELETEDYEWDEGLTQNITPALTSHPNPLLRRASFSSFGKEERGFISGKQRLGLVRRYAPRKTFVCYNYALT
ncbi:MAG: hypothetical protein IKO26_02960 [Paludibacteraceae bacterium]|nr:hypothetical protein [Paludibacteraceae bacterium]